MGVWEEQAKRTTQHRQQWSKAQEFNFIEALLGATNEEEARIFRVVEFRLFYESHEYQWENFRPSSPDPKLIQAVKNSKILESNRVYKITSQDDSHIFSSRIYKILTPNKAYIYFLIAFLYFKMVFIVQFLTVKSKHLCKIWNTWNKRHFPAMLQ